MRNFISSDFYMMSAKLPRDDKVGNGSQENRNPEISIQISIFSSCDTSKNYLTKSKKITKLSNHKY